MIKSGWEVVIGLEIHAQIASESKLFSNAPVGFGSEPNSSVDLFDISAPGVLPILNDKCVELAVKTGLGVDATINKESVFDRKHYFYPDLPSGYQITQFYKPIAVGGKIVINNGKVIRIERIHIEQDAGKSIHDKSASETFIDLNRAGVGLMEIVTAPDLRSSSDASEFISKLRSILRYLGTCDGDMEKGSLRCDANVSVMPAGSTIYGNRVEIKNLNSLKFIEKAIEFEAKRQINEIENGNKIIQETRLFDTDKLETRSMRLKEDSVDYRYFPDPDILPVILSDSYIDSIRSNLPELPDEKLKRYIESFNLPITEARVLVSDKAVSDYFEEVCIKVSDPKLVTNWIIVELFARMNKLGIKINDEANLLPSKFAELLLLIKEQKISLMAAKQVLDLMFETGNDALSIVNKNSLMQINDSNEIVSIVERVLLENADEVKRYRMGEEKLFGFLVGCVMKAASGKANPSTVSSLLKKLLLS